MRVVEGDDHTVDALGDDHADADAAGFGEAGVDEGLVIRAVEEAVAEAAGKALSEVAVLLI